MEWLSTGKQVYDTLADYNNKNNVQLPYEAPYRAKYLPRMVFLRWQDAAQYGAGNTQYTTWKWNLPRDLINYSTVSLVSIDYNRAYFTAPGHYIMLGVEEIQSSAIITTADTLGLRLINPTFIVPDKTAAPEFYNNQYEDRPWSVSVLGTQLQSLTVHLGDESMAPLVFNAVSGTFYCNVVLLFQ